MEVTLTFSQDAADAIARAHERDPEFGQAFARLAEFALKLKALILLAQNSIDDGDMDGGLSVLKAAADFAGSGDPHPVARH